MLHVKDRFSRRIRAKCIRGGVGAGAAIMALAAVVSSASAQSSSEPAVKQPAQSSEPAWKTSPYHGLVDGDGNVIPCRCLYRGRQYMLGEKVCMNTYRGTVITECDMQLNNTSWVPSAEACSTS